MKCRHSHLRLGVQILGEDASGEGVGREVVNLAFAELATQCFSPRLHPITAAMAKLRGRCANTAASVQRYCQYQYRCFRAAGALAGWCLREGWNLQVSASARSKSRRAAAGRAELLAN